MPPVTDPHLPPPAPGAATAEPVPSPVAPQGAWGPGRALLGIVVLIVAASLEVSVIAGFGDVKTLAGKLVLQAMLAMTLIGVAFALAGRGGRPAALGLRRPRESPVRYALIGYAAYFVVVIAYASFVHPHQKDLTRSLGFGHGAGVSVIVGLLIIVAAPVAEEIFFRGFLFGGLRRGLPFLAAALVSAVIFGAFHYTGPHSLTVLPQLAFLGLVLAWIYERSGSIYPTIALHVLNNALAFAVLTS
jgi:membrane protease YdiL (CAAX protease family)